MIKEEFEKFRQKVSQIIGQAIPPRSAESIILDRDKQGVVGQKQMIRIFIALYDFLEVLTEKEVVAVKEGISKVEDKIETEPTAPVTVPPAPPVPPAEVPVAPVMPPQPEVPPTPAVDSTPAVPEAPKEEVPTSA